LYFPAGLFKIGICKNKDRKGRKYMKKNRIRQTIAVTLCAAMTVGLCGCGGGSNSGKKDDGSKHYFNVTYLDQLPDNFEQLGSSLFKGDCIYYTAYDEDYTTESVYSYNLVEQTESVLWQGSSETTEDGISTYSCWINNFTVDDDGNVYAYMQISKVKEESLNKDYSGATLDDVLDYIVNEWGYEEPPRSGRIGTRLTTRTRTAMSTMVIS
jgi:hypothetical protein